MRAPRYIAHARDAVMECHAAISALRRHADALFIRALPLAADACRRYAISLPRDDTPCAPSRADTDAGIEHCAFAMLSMMPPRLIRFAVTLMPFRCRATPGRPCLCRQRFHVFMLIFRHAISRLMLR